MHALQCTAREIIDSLSLFVCNVAVSRCTSQTIRGVLLALVAMISCGEWGVHADDFEFRKGDRIALLGNTLADRMQHDGFLES
ncbi:MAG: hypothetical protein RLY14_2795, partial [Planctomycetota bacterium]